MRRIEGRPRDLTDQFLGYARSGRLVEVRPGRAGAALPTVAAGAAAVGSGSALWAAGLLTEAGPAAVPLGVALVIVGAVLLARVVRLLRSLHARSTIQIRPGAVLPPELVRKGNWIHRDGGWVRVEHIGRNGGGRVHALLGSGDVIELRTPVTVAGDQFRPAEDPVESLRG